MRTDEHHHAGDVEQKTEDANIAREMASTFAAVMQKADKGEEEGLDKSLKDQRSLNASDPGGALVLMSANTGTVRRAIDAKRFHYRRKKQKGVQDSARVNRGMIWQISEESAKDEVF
ncbi:hypothetical protein MMC13_002158 [Lambiella insularis]|nr:hypothetical protein [Lambiella insularis]